MKCLNNLADRIQVGQKHIKTDDRKDNVSVVKGLVRGGFTKEDVPVLGHGPGLIFDFENSLRRSKTETSRYEFKQGLRLDDDRQVDKPFMESLCQTMSAIANLGPDADGFVYLGIADNSKDTARVVELDGVIPIRFEHVDIVGIDREAKALGRPLDRYMRALEDAISIQSWANRSECNFSRLSMSSLQGPLSGSPSGAKTERANLHWRQVLRARRVRNKAGIRARNRCR